MALLREAFEAATLRADRLRLRVLLGVLEMARGERLDEIHAEVSELASDTTELEDLFGLYMVRGEIALLTGDVELAHTQALKLVDLSTMNPEIPIGLAARAAVWGRNLDRAREIGELMAQLPGTGASTQAMRIHHAAAIAALEGRTPEAVAGFREVDTLMRDLGQFFEAARYAVDAVILLPDHPEIRLMAEAARPLLVELRAKPYLERLDAALAGSAVATPSRVPIAISAEPPARARGLFGVMTYSGP
jgi:hypothetical protein